MCHVNTFQIPKRTLLKPVSVLLRSQHLHRMRFRGAENFDLENNIRVMTVFDSAISGTGDAEFAWKQYFLFGRRRQKRYLTADAAPH